MRGVIVLLLLCVFCGLQSNATNFHGPAELCSILLSRCFPAYVWNMDAPVNASLGTQEVFRIEVTINPLSIYEKEVTVRRLNRTDGPESVMQYQMPFDSVLGNPYDCCIHEALGVSSRARIPAVVNQTFSLPRKDGFQTLRILGVYTNLTDLQLYNLSLAVTNPTASWFAVNNVCPVACAVQSNYVFVLDGSGSIDNNEYDLISFFLQSFVARSTINENAANMGAVYFGYEFSSTGSNSLYCIADLPNNFLKQNSTSGSLKISNMAQDLWFQALGDPDWYTIIFWPYAVNKTLINNNNLYCFKLDPIVAGCEGGQCAGTVYAFLYISPDGALVSQAIESFRSQRRASGAIFQGNTPTGSGIQMGIDLYDRAAVFRPTVPEIMILLTDGLYNSGVPAQAASDIARTLGITTYGINVVTGDDTQVTNLAGSSSRFFKVTTYNVTAFNAILDPLLSATCLGESGTGANCPNCPASSLCSTCGSCVSCLQDKDCNPCQSCDLSSRQCQDRALGASCPFSAPTPCDAWICDTVKGCQLQRDGVVESGYRTACVNDKKGSWNSTICFCFVPDSDPTSSGTQDGIIIGTTVGAVGAAGLATLGTLVGGAALCILAALALILAVIALVIIGVVLIIGLLALAVVGGLGIAALVMGIKMAIPPAIKGIEVANTADISAMENPLAKASEWTSSKASTE